MDEEVVIDLFNRAKGLGYSKSIDDFKLLLSTDNQVIDDNFQYVKSQGYGKGIEDFKILIGASPQVVTETIEEPVKKKEDTESVSEDGSLVSQDAREIQHRAYGQDTPLKGFGALSLETTTPEEEEKMLQAAREYNASQPQPVAEEEVDIFQTTGIEPAKDYEQREIIDEQLQVTQEPSVDPYDFSRRDNLAAQISAETQLFKGEERAESALMSPKERRKQDIVNRLRTYGDVDGMVTDEMVQEIIDKEDELRAEGISNKLQYLDIYNAFAEANGLEKLSPAEYIGTFEEVRTDKFGYPMEDIEDVLDKKEMFVGDEFEQAFQRLADKDDSPKVTKRLIDIDQNKKQKFIDEVIEVDRRMLGEYEIDKNFNQLYSKGLDFTALLDNDTRANRSEEINKNKLLNLYIGKYIPKELYEKVKYAPLTDQDRDLLKQRADENFIRSFGEEEWKEYQNITGNSNPVFIDTEYEMPNRGQGVSSKVKDAIVVGNEAATVANLKKILSPDRFQVFGSGTVGEYVTIRTLDNDGRVVNSEEFYLEESNDPKNRIALWLAGAFLSKEDRAKITEIDRFFESDTSGVKTVLKEDGSGEYVTKYFDRDPVKELEAYNYLLSDPQKFGDAYAESIYDYESKKMGVKEVFQPFAFTLLERGYDYLTRKPADRSIAAVNIDGIETFLKKNKGNINPETIKLIRQKMAQAQSQFSRDLTQQGSWASALMTGASKFLYGFAEGGTGLTMSIPSPILSNEERREIKNTALNAIEKAKNRVSGTTPESMAVRPMGQKAADAIVDMMLAVPFGGFVSKSLGLTGKMATTGRKVKQLLATGSGFAPQTFGAISQELKDVDIPEYQKGLMALPITFVEQILEGIGGVQILNKGNLPFFMNLAMKTLKDLPKDASEQTIKLALRKSFRGRLAQGLGFLTTSSLTEAGTEGSQTLSEDFFKRIYNTFFEEKDVFHVPDLSTSEGVEEYLSRVYEAMILGAISGPVGGGGFHAVGQLRNGYTTRKANREFKLVYDQMMSAQDFRAAKVQMELAVEEGIITEQEKNEYIQEYNEAYSLMEKIPKDLSTNSKRESYILLREKEQIEEKIKGKDPALEKESYERIKEINDQLEVLGKQKRKTTEELKQEDDAISEQETTPVDEDQQATDVQEVEEGVPTAEPQQTTVEETTTEEVEKAPLTEEQQEVVSLEEDIEGKVTEGRELPGQEVVEETQEVTEEAPVEEKKLIYDEKKTRSKGQQLVIERAQKAIKALSKIAPDVKIIIHEDTKSFKKAAGGEGAGAITGGNTIHVNMDKANNRTIAHEVMHAVLIKKLGAESDIRKVTARMLEGIKKGLIKGGGKVEITIPETIDGKRVETKREVTIEEYLEIFSEQYEENMQDEEKVAELAGLLANNYTNLEVKEKGLIKRWVQKIFKPIAKQLGININEVTKTDKDIIDFLNVVSRKTTLGEQIQEAETEALTRVKEEAAAKKKVTKKKPKETTKKVTEEEVKVSEEVTTPIAKPKVVVSGTSDGYQVVSSANTTQAENESIKDARGDKTFDKDGFRITKLEDGSSQVSYKSKVKVSDKGNRPGYAMATVIIPEGSPVNKQQIKEAFDNKLSEIIESNRKKKLGAKFSDLTTEQNQQLTDAVVNAISQERVADKVTPVVEAAPTKKKINWTKSEGKRPKRKTQGTELGKLVRQYESGEITIEEYNEQAEKLSPTRMKEKFTEPATEAELGKLRKGKLEKRNTKVEDGVEVGLRIDIPFMEDTGQASVTIHKGKGLSSPAVSYRGSAVIENVEFKSSPSGSLKLASEVTTKNPTLARMVGNFVNIGETIEQQNEAAKKLSEQAMNEGWTQVGVNPSKHSYFYDRATGKPLKSADRVVQVGDLIYAENAQTTDIYDSRFIVKGKTDKAGKPLRFQKADIEVKSLPTSIQESLKFAEKSSFRNKLEFKNALQKNFNDKVFPIIQEKYGVKDNRSNTDENLKKYLLDAYLNETLTAIEAYPDALGWYDARINGAMSLMEELHPELATDKDAASTFKIALAITSNGNKVYDNFVEANRQYEYFKENKRFDESYSIGDQRAGILSTLSFVNQALQSMSMKDFTSFLTTQYRAGDLKYIKDGKKVPLLPGFAVDEMVYGASIFGPKIGNGFFMNLYGEFNQLTMDRWFMRQYGRLTGTLIDFDQRKVDLGIKRLDKAKKALAKRNSEKLSQIIPGWDTMSSEELSNKIAKASMDLKKRAIFKSNPKLDEIRKAGNNLSKLLSAEAEAPRNSSQRKFINEVFTELQDVLKNEYNIDITIADLQAVNWYPEKALYQTFKADQNTKTGKTTTSDNEQPDYESAARKLVKSKGVSETKIKENEQRRNKQIKRDESNRNSIRERTIELNKDDKKSSETKRLKEKIISIKEDITRGDMNLSSQEVSEIADREQKSLIQIGRYYNANNQGFFPAQVNEFQLRRDLQAIGLDLKRAKNGAYYATRNGRKTNIFPPSPSPYSRFQKADIEITEPTVFNKKDAAEDIIRTARKKGYNDKSIRFYLLNRRKGEFKAKEVDALLKLDATLFDQLPESFAEVEGGAIAGLKLFEKIDKFRQKLMDQNNRIKKPFLEEKQIQELVKEKRKELKKQGLSKEEIRKKLEAFEKRERANNKKRTKRLTLSEIMDKTIEFMEQQPEYKREADSYVEDGVTKYRKGVSTQQAKMQAELQETIGQKPTKEVAENIAKLKRNVKSWEKGQRDLQAIKNELKRLMRKHLPKDMYSKKEALDLIKAISDANKENINVQIEKVTKLIVKKNNERLTREALDLLNIVTQKKESGKLKGVKVSNEVRKRLEAIIENVLDPKKLSETDGELLAEKNLMLTKQFNLINQQATLTQEDLNNLIDLQIAIALNQAQQLEMDNPYRIEAMESAVDSLDRLIMGGRGALQVQLEQAHAEYQRQFAELWEQITGQKLDMSDPDVQDKIDARLKQEVSRKDREEGQKRFRRILSMTYRITGQGINNHEALFGLMDKINVMPGELAGGRIQEIVTQRVDEASIKYKGRTMEQEDIIREKAKEIFGSKWKRKMKQFQAKTDNIFYLDLKQDRKPLSQNEMAYMYNQFKDPSLHPTFERMLGENYEQIMKELESKLDPELKQWADWMVDEYFPSVYDHYNETYKKIYRTDMPFNQNYAGRIFREGLDKNKPLDLLGNSPISQTSVAPGSVMVRDEKATSNILPMDINNALLSYVQEMEYFAAYAEPIRDINKMFNNDNTSKFITKVYGKNVQELIEDQIQKISGKGIQSAKRAAVINFLNNSFIYAKIALSPVVFIKQLTSIFTYANDIGYANWVLYGGSAALKTPIGMGKTWREITENSVYLQDRARGANIKRAIGNYYDSSNQLINNSFLDASQKALLYTTKAGDKLAIMLGGIPNYLYYKDQYRKKNPKATEQEVIDYAIKKFEKDTKQTQQSSDLQDRDYYQTSDGFMRAMNMFLTTPKQYLRKEIIALRNLRRLINGQAARGTAFENVRQFVTYHFAMPMLFQWATIGFPLGDDWDEEDSSDMIRAAVLGNLNGVFVLGDILGSIADLIQGKPWAGEVNSIPLFIQTADVFKALKELGQKVNAKNPDTKKIQEAQYDVYASLGGLFGLPLDQINKAIKNFSKLRDEKDAKKIFLRVLNYSEHVVEDPKKDKKKKKSGVPEAPEAPKAPKAPKPPGYTEPEKKDLAPIKAIIKGLTEY